MRRVFTIFLSLLIGVGVIGFFAGRASAEYYGARWRTNSVCVHNQVSDPTIRQAVYEAVHLYDDYTTLKVVNHGKSACKGYSQVINVVDNYYGRIGWNGTVRYGGFDWGKTTMGWWTYFFRSGVTVKLNQSYGNNTFGWRHIAAHELAHALGLNENKSTCKSVLGYGCPWLDKPTNVDYRELNSIYSR